MNSLGIKGKIWVQIFDESPYNIGPIYLYKIQLWLSMQPLLIDLPNGL